MSTILITDPLAEEGLAILRKEKSLKVEVKAGLAPEELKAAVATCEAWIVRSGTKVTKDLIQRAERLRVIGRAGIGLDNVDVDAATQRGVIVMNSPAGNIISTAEHTLSLMLALARNIPQADASVKGGQWQRSKFIGVELYGKTLGVVGLGRIGGEAVRRAQAFGVKVIAYDPHLTEDRARAMEVRLVGLEELLKTADYITFHTPLTEETRHMIGEREVAVMKRGTRLINCARGGIFDEAAVARGIERGIIAGVALDVFEEEPPKNCPLLKFDNVIATPHLGASTEEAQVNVSVDIAIQVRDALLGRGVRNAVNFPSLDPETHKRLEPYIRLAEKIGSFQGQLADGPIRQIRVTYAGEVASGQTSPITIALIKGLLTPTLGETVNYVNASVIAKERGIRIVESKAEEIEHFTNVIRLEVTSEKGTSQIVGGLFARGEPRIVRINEFVVDAIPSGYMILTSNLDRPGMIGQLGTILGNHKINIAGMTFGREAPGKRAIMLLNVDQAVSPQVQDEIRRAKHVLDVRVMKL